MSARIPRDHCQLIDPVDHCGDLLTTSNLNGTGTI